VLIISFGQICCRFVNLLHKVIIPGYACSNVCVLLVSFKKRLVKHLFGGITTNNVVSLVRDVVSICWNKTFVQQMNLFLTFHSSA